MGRGCVSCLEVEELLPPFAVRRMVASWSRRCRVRESHEVYLWQRVEDVLCRCRRGVGLRGERTEVNVVCGMTLYGCRRRR